MARKSDDAAPKVVLFLDRCLGGKLLSGALRERGYAVEVHGDHFADDAADTDWIAEVAKREWVILSKDGMIRRRELERRALEDHDAVAFILTNASASAEQFIAAFAAAMPRIERLVATHTRPLICMVSPSGDIRVLTGERRGGKRQ